MKKKLLVLIMLLSLGLVACGTSDNEDADSTDKDNIEADDDAEDDDVSADEGVDSEGESDEDIDNTDDGEEEADIDESEGNKEAESDSKDTAANSEEGEEDIDSAESTDSQENSVRDITMTVSDMSIEFSALPETLAEFETLIDEDFSQPEEAAGLFFCAVNLLSINADEGIAAINMLKGPVELSDVDKSWFKDRISDKLYLARAYFEGSTPENNYAPTEPYTILFQEDPRPGDVEEGYMRFYVDTPAFDSARYIKLRQHKDNWYIWDINNIMVGVREPAEEDPWS